MFTAFQRIAFLLLFSLVAVTPCVAQFGGGGPGGTGDIEITDMTFSSSTAKLTVKYRLAHDFKSSPQPYATVINDGAVVKIQELDDHDANPSPAAVYTVDIPMGAHGEGDYQLTMAYDADFPDMPDTMTLDFSIDSADDVDQGSAAYTEFYAPFLGAIPFVAPGNPCMMLNRSNGLVNITPCNGNQFSIVLFEVNGEISPRQCPAGGGGSKGCNTCGGGNGPLAPYFCFSLDVQMQASVLGGFAGPGIMWCFHKPGYAAAGKSDGTEVVLRLADSELCNLVVMSDEEDGTVDGILACRHKEYIEGRMYDSSDNLETDIRDVDEIHITRIDGSVLVFELWDIVQSNDSDLDWQLRLKRIEQNDRTLVTMSYNANEGIPTEAEDYLGFKMTFEATATVGGNQAISKVTYAGKSVDVTYDGLFPELDYPDGSDFRVTLTSGTEDKLKVESPFEPTKYYYFTQEYNVAGEVINLPCKVLTGIKESTDTNYLWAISYNSGNSAEARILREGKILELYHNDGDDERSLRKYDSWTLANWNNWSATGFTTETEYPEIEYSGLGTNDTRRAFQAGQTVYLKTGEKVTVEYDSNYRRTKRTYEDGTAETWAYDSSGNITRYEDRDDRVTKYTYHSTMKNLVTEKKVGIVNTGTKASPTDVNQTSSVSASGYDEYAVYKYDYFTTGDKKGLLKTEKMPRWTTQTDLYRTDYDYTFTSGVLTKITVTEAADVASGTRPVTTYDYNSSGQVSKVTDPLSRETENFFDDLHRKYKVEYHDGSTEKNYYYSTAGKEGLIEKSKDRNGVSTKFEHDVQHRVTKITRGYSTITLTDTETTNSDALTKSITEYTYDGNSERVDYQIADGKKTSYTYDFRGRVTETSVYPYTGKTLTSKTSYDDNNRVFYTEDPYGRRNYIGYSAYNTTEQVRNIQCTKDSVTYASNTAIMAATRDSSNNTGYIITDAIKDGEGNIDELIDTRNITTKYYYDSRGQQYKRLDAEGKTIEAKTETDYDVDGNVTEARGPRYFDSGDTDGYQKAKTTYAYNGRGLRSSTTEAAGSSIAATTSVTYKLDGRVDKTTDARNNDWYSYWHSCCGRPQGSKDPAGHGSITNNDYMGRVTHTAVVSDYSTHSNLHNPTDSKTLGESTTRYDILGRPIARTQWLVARGTVDEQDPPIAGLDSVAAADGITTQTIYDNDLKDNVGLDNSTGVTVDKLGGGTFNVSLSNAITQLADTVANGGAGITFTADVSSGSAVVRINGEEEISFSISDATGRTVMSGQIQSYADTSPNTLIVHSCMTYDAEVNISGWGDVVETKTVDADGEVVKSRTDGAGRTLETEDQDGNVSTMKYDANGNLKESRDANSVGVDIVYDDLNRPTSRTDTWDDETTIAYYLSGMVKTETDAKSKSKTFAYDERGRRDKITDRLGNDTTYTYDKNSNLLSISDAESKVTSYTYNSRNLKDKETYPDHTGGVSGAATYGIVEFSFDDAGRVEMKTDQNGDTVTFNYDLAGRMTKRDYRLKANSPSGTIADSDTFTFDKAGRTLTAVSGRYSNTVTMTYDMAGRLDDESLTISGKTYTVSNEYNDLGQLHKQTYPDSTVVERAYTDRGQLYTVKYGSNIEDTRTYDVGGRLSTSTYRNGVVTTYNYRNSSGDKDNLISSIVTTNSGTQKIGTYTYTYDTNKNKTKETITLSAINNKSFDTTAGTDPDGYDDDDRLTYWKRSDNNLTHEWTLTDVGDWSALKTNGTSVSRTHSNAHEVTAVGATSLTHDVEGNLTANPLRNHNYTWDFDNRMSGADTDGDTTTDVSFEYDALGRRVKKGSTVYAYSGQQVIAEYSSGANPSSPTEQYVYASYIDEPILKDGTLSSGTGIVYYSRNQQYSITGLTDTSGNVVERYSYSAYGDLTIYDSTGTSIASSAYANPYTYTGRRFDSETEIYHFRARMYDAELGRFIGRDPFGFVDGENLYRGYFAVNALDPSGKWIVQDRKEFDGPTKTKDDTSVIGRLITAVSSRISRRSGALQCQCRLIDFKPKLVAYFSGPTVFQNGNKITTVCAYSSKITFNFQCDSQCFFSKKNGCCEKPFGPLRKGTINVTFDQQIEVKAGTAKCPPVTRVQRKARDVYDRYFTLPSGATVLTPVALSRLCWHSTNYVDSLRDCPFSTSKLVVPHMEQLFTKNGPGGRLSYYKWVKC